jgi:diadenosine tetraphosphate (Ap4A) HIT family hydrolase
MASLRTPEGKAKFHEHLKTVKPTDGCPLCTYKSIKDFKLWRIIGNRFPYDKIAKTHHMIIPMRHVTERELTKEELVEFKEIKDSFLESEYDWLIEATHKNKSVPEHFHLHLIVGA